MNEAIATFTGEVAEAATPDLIAPGVIYFIVPGRPVPWARAGRNGARSFTPPKRREYMRDIAWRCKAAMAGRRPLSGPIRMQVIAQYERPKRAGATLRWRSGRPDCDNIAKLCADALNCIAFADDAQIVSLHVFKIYGQTAELRVKIEGADSAELSEWVP